MSRSFRVCVLASVIVLLDACGGSAPPATQAASSAGDPAEATQLRDTIQRPINRAKSVEGIIMKSHNRQDQQLQGEENGDPGSASSDASSP